MRIAALEDTFQPKMTNLPAHCAGDSGKAQTMQQMLVPPLCKDGVDKPSRVQQKKQARKDNIAPQKSLRLMSATRPTAETLVLFRPASLAQPRAHPPSSRTQPA